MQVRKQFPHEFGSRLSQPIPFSLVSAQVGLKSFIDPRLAIELTHQRCKIEDLEQTRRKVVRTIRSFKRRWLTQHKGQGDITRGLVGSSRAGGELIVLVEAAQLFAQSWIEFSL